MDRVSTTGSGLPLPRRSFRSARGPPPRGPLGFVGEAKASPRGSVRGGRPLSNARCSLPGTFGLPPRELARGGRPLRCSFWRGPLEGALFASGSFGWEPPMPLPFARASFWRGPFWNLPFARGSFVRGPPFEPRGSFTRGPPWGPPLARGSLGRPGAPLPVRCPVCGGRAPLPPPLGGGRPPPNPRLRPPRGGGAATAGLPRSPPPCLSTSASNSRSSASAASSGVMSRWGAATCSTGVGGGGRNPPLRSSPWGWNPWFRGPPRP